MFNDMFTLQGRWNRLNRQRYFGYSLLLTLLIFVLAFGLGMAGILTAEMMLTHSMEINLGFMAVTLWPSICLSVKRLHDLDKPGWLWVLFIVPLVGFFLWIYLTFWKGTEGENQFGPDPLAL